jgi:colicin import membrane protein
MRGLWQLFCVTFIVLGTACGGSSDGPPGPLSKHIDDMHIARIPLDQQGSVVEAQNKWSISKMEAANAEAQVQEADSQLHQARNDHKAAKLAIDSAIAAKKSAEQSADMNRINTAQNDVRNAEASEKAAASRVKYFEAYKNYLKRFHRYAQENMYFREAQYEAAKAQIAKSNNIAPRGVNLDDFPKQAQDRGKRTDNAKSKAESEKQKAVSARSNWLSQQSAADKATGRTGTLYDPMAPKEGGPAMKDGGIAKEKPEEIKPMGSNPGNMNTTPANTENKPENKPAEGGGDAPQQ